MQMCNGVSVGAAIRFAIDRVSWLFVLSLGVFGNYCGLT